MDSRWKARAYKFWREFGKPFLVIVFAVSSFRSAVADWNDVPTGSMKPTILEGERIFVNKVAYGLRIPFTRWRVLEWSGPKRGDIVVFFSPADDVRTVKRVIGLPGDRIEMRNNRLLVNGARAEYEPIDPRIESDLAVDGSLASRFAGRSRFIVESIGERSHSIIITPRRSTRSSFAPLTVPDGQYFMMGDNRDNSRDSRWFGVVERESKVGRATAVVVSLDPDRHYLPRWRRFLHSLN